VKKSVPAILAALAALWAAPLWALENHADYRKMKPTECNECHRDSGVPPNHQGGWNSDHRRIASRAEGGTNCTQCHDQAYCADCHSGGAANAGPGTPTSRSGGGFMPRSHRSAFIEIHPVAAADNPASCNRCHPVSYCVDCHARFQPADLAFLSHRKGFSGIAAGSGGPLHATFPESACKSCHPRSVLPSLRWTSSHRQEARRNLAACQSCHPDGDVCLKCHSARSGLKVNPHPDDFGRISGRLNRIAGKRTCVKCH
jgi:hypothetical protein